MKQNLTYLVCFLITILTSLNVDGQVQDKKINLPDAPLTGHKIVTAIKTQSGIRFNYAEALDPKLANIIKTEKHEVTVKMALELIKAACGLNYELDNEYVTLSQSVPKNPNVLAGQEKRNGTLKGRIVEFETSQPLLGASVRIVELNVGISSDNNGYYRLTNIPDGKYTLQVSFVAYATERVSVTISSGKDVTYDVKLQGSNTLSEVVINGVGKTHRPVSHTSEKQILEQVKQPSLVVSAISSEQIAKSADRNAAEVIRKISGITVADDKFVIVRGLNPRYNLTYLNDNVAPSTEIYSRAFALDLIPSRIIDRIMVYKSAGPEILGDATGGVVKIYTKDAKNVKHFDIEFQLGVRPGTTFNSNFLTYNGGKLDFLGIDDGTRKLPSSVPAYDQLALAQLSPSQYASTFNSTLAYRRMTALPNMQLTANYYNAFKVGGKTVSALTSLSYKNESLKTDVYRQQGLEYPESNGSAIDRISNEGRNTQTVQLNLLQNFVMKLRDSSSISFKNFLLQQGQDLTIVRMSRPTVNYNIFPNVVANKDNILSFGQRFLYAGNLGGIHYYDAGKHLLQWNAGYTYSLQSTPDQRVIRLTAPTGLVAIGDTSLQWRARGQNLAAADTYDPIPSRLGIISRLWMRNSEGNYNGSVDYTYKWKPWLSLRVGTFQQWKQRKLFRRIYTVHEGDNTDPDNVYYQPGTGHYIDPQLVRFREQDLSHVWTEEYLRDDYSGLRVYDRTSGSDSYLGTEQNSSGYFALHLTPLSRKFEVYGGLRYEYNRQQIGAAIPKAISTEINTPVYIDNPMKTWLPSVNASWRPNESLVVRAAYGKTVNRTEFREVAPYEELDFENNTIVRGNETLKSATVNNYDFRIELYPDKNAKGEMISAGIFYKELKNPIERINTSSRVEAIFPSISYQNAASATIKGLEIEVNKKLDFISGKFFRDLAIIGNLTWIKSRTENDTTILSSLALTPDDGRPLQGQSPYIINAGLYYDNAALGTKVAIIYSTSGENIYAAGRGYKKNDFSGFEYRGSLIELPRHVLDLSLTQRLVQRLQAKLSIQNVLNQSVRTAEDYNFTNKYEPEKKDGDKWTGDNISSSYNPGRHFVLSLSYSL
jgi:Outer membrane receptor proteins, mostly Fe transport